MISLFQFQQAASTQIADRFLEYYVDPVVKGSRKRQVNVPFFQALASLTGSGKTAILADAVNQMAGALPIPPVVLWLSKAKVVVEQSFSDLAEGGKYHHLLGASSVRPLADYKPEHAEEDDRTIVYFATVGTFNQRDMEEGNLRIYKSDTDNTEKTTWNALHERLHLSGARRPLIVVYDEAQNLSDQQTELLLSQEPDAFLVASATMRIPAALDAELGRLKEAGRNQEWLVTVARSSAVVESGLVKNTISLGGYRSPMEETISALLADMGEAERDAQRYGVGISPRAIYVCKTNVVADDAFRRDDPRQPFEQRQAPPILIWRYLVEQCGVAPASVAIYANLDTHRDYPLPDELCLFNGGDNDYREFTSGGFRHVIFNLTLQEGWDDPETYFAYVDKSMESTVQITQIIGRVLRQPSATHYPSDRLNTAHFYVRVDKNEVFTEVLREVSERLGSDAPEIRIIAADNPSDRPIERLPRIDISVPRTGVDGRDALPPIELLLEHAPDYRDGGINTSGVGSRLVVEQKVGTKSDSSDAWEDFEQVGKVSARWVFHREIKRLYSRALDVANTADPRFDAQIGMGSPAYRQVVDLAEKVVHEYIENVRLVQRRLNPFVVGPILARDADIDRFEHSIHEGYDRLNPLELRTARAIDAMGLPWYRNPSRSGYEIPLVSIGDTENFYPDFIFWTDESAICIDTKGGHLLIGDAGRKLLAIESRPGFSRKLVVRFITEGKWNADMEKLSADGVTVWGLKADGKRRASYFPSIEAAVSSLTDK